MSTDKYIDPSNYEEIIKQLHDTQNVENVIKLINTIYPTWFVDMANIYSEDYTHLTKNWDRICNMIGTKKYFIIFVDEIINDENHKLINYFCEWLTRTGFCVRRNNEFILCDKCKAVIPCENLWKLLKKSNTPNIPQVWKNHCSKCK
jgi:hypothetical protein